MAKNVLFLASGRGSNFQSFVDHLELKILNDVEIKALVSNRSGAPVLDIARRAAIPVFEIEGITGKKFDSHEEREKARIIFDNQCVALARSFSIDFVVLAGFDQILSKSFVDNVPNRILNIHPAYDLRTFGGRNMVGAKVHDAVIRNGVSYSGCTVHLVRHDIDQGPAILKQKVPTMPEDTPETLELRILQQEHLIYPEALQLLVDGRVKVSSEGSRCFVDRYSENWDIQWWERQEQYLKFIAGKRTQPVAARS